MSERDIPDTAVEAALDAYASYPNECEAAAGFVRGLEAARIEAIEFAKLYPRAKTELRLLAGHLWDLARAPTHGRPLPLPPKVTETPPKGS